MNPPSHPVAILFDLDDTIIDYGSSAEPLWRAVCDEAARDLRGTDADALMAAINRVRAWFWSDPERHRQGRADLRAASEQIAAQALRELGHDAPYLARGIAITYRERRDRSLELLPNAVATLEDFRRRGVRLGLVTNGTGADQRAKIERFALAAHFEHILIEGEFGCGKPDERVYRAALGALRVRPEDTWFVGDNLDWDVAAPQRLGLYAIWVDRDRTGVPPESPVQPDRVIHSLSELL